MLKTIIDIEIIMLFVESWQQHFGVIIYNSLLLMTMLFKYFIHFYVYILTIMISIW